MARRSRTSTGAVVWFTPSSSRFGLDVCVLMALLNLWTAESEFAAQTASTTRKTKPER